MTQAVELVPVIDQRTRMNALYISRDPKFPNLENSLLKSIEQSKEAASLQHDNITYVMRITKLSSGFTSVELTDPNFPKSKVVPGVDLGDGRKWSGAVEVTSPYYLTQEGVDAIKQGDKGTWILP